MFLKVICSLVLLSFTVNATPMESLKSKVNQLWGSIKYFSKNRTERVVEHVLRLEKNLLLSYGFTEKEISLYLQRVDSDIRSEISQMTARPFAHHARISGWVEVMQLQDSTMEEINKLVAARFNKNFDRERVVHHALMARKKILQMYAVSAVTTGDAKERTGLAMLFHSALFIGAPLSALVGVPIELWGPILVAGYASFEINHMRGDDAKYKEPFLFPKFLSWFDIQRQSLRLQKFADGNDNGKILDFPVPDSTLAEYDLPPSGVIHELTSENMLDMIEKLSNILQDEVIAMNEDNCSSLF